MNKQELIKKITSQRAINLHFYFVLILLLITKSTERYVVFFFLVLFVFTLSFVMFQSRKGAHRE